MTKRDEGEMTWNHRIIEHGPEDFRLHEVFYSEDGAVEMWTENAVDVAGENREEILILLRQMLRDAERSCTLKIEDLEAGLKRKRRKR